MTQKEIFHPSLTATAHTHRPGSVDSRTHVDHEAWSVKVAGTTPQEPGVLFSGEWRRRTARIRGSPRKCRATKNRARASTRTLGTSS